MRYFWLAVLVGSVAMFTGCATLAGFASGLVGGGGDGPGAAMGGAAGALLSTFIPWFGTAAGVIGTVVEDVKRKKHLKTAETLVRGIRKAKDANLDWKATIKIISEEQDKEGVRANVRKLKHKIEKGG